MAPPIPAPMPASQVPITDLESPSEGSATLTDAQAAELAGREMVREHPYRAHPDGEIRGQVVPGGM